MGSVTLFEDSVNIEMVGKHVEGNCFTSSGVLSCHFPERLEKTTEDLGGVPAEIRGEHLPFTYR